MASYAIIGFGCAGYNALAAIREKDPIGTIDVFSEHWDPPYNPMLTTYYASNRLEAEGLFPFGDLETIAHMHNANIYPGTRVTALDGGTRTVTLADGTQKSYDKVLIATGARAFVPPIVNECPENCIVMRTLEDARGLKKILEEREIRQAVVIGASMAGIKVVEVLHNNGIHTVMGDMAPYIFPLAAYPETAAIIEKKLAAQGVEMYFRKGLTAVRKGTDMAAAVEFNDGTLVSADLVCLCIGTRAATELAVGAGIQVGRCITVNTSMETSVPGIYAAGDCTEGCNIQSGQNMNIGLWANAAYQGRTAGANMAGGTTEFKGNILHNITHFFHMDFIGFGDNRVQGDKYIFTNQEKGLFVLAVMKEGRLAGLNILGSYRISGILKNHILAVIQNGAHHISDIQRGVLIREGLSEAFLRLLEGGTYGD